MLAPQQALWLELLQFYIREAWLLGERKFEEWLDLFTDDVLYFMPRRKNVPFMPRRKNVPRRHRQRARGRPAGLHPGISVL
jgi:3-phenylpropionate/cinnamic acid dioxygenase small subunit